MHIHAITQVRLAGQAQPLGMAIPVRIGIDSRNVLNAGHVVSAIARHAHACASQDAVARGLRALLSHGDAAATADIHPDQFWLFINGKPYTSPLWTVAPWRKLNVLIVAIRPLD